MPAQIYFFHSDAQEIVRKFILGYSPAQLWYLLMLFLVFALVFPVAKKIQSLKTSQAYSLAFALYLFGMSLYMISAPFQLPATFVHVAFFILGMVFRKNSAVVGSWFAFFVLHLILFSLCYRLASETSTAIKILRYTLTFFVNIAGTFMTVSLIQKYEDFSFFTDKLYHFFKENSFTMYILHQQIIYFVIAAFNGVFEPLLLAAINFVAAISISSIICAIFNSFKAMRFLIGK